MEMDTSYHIYAKDRVLYCNLNEEDFEEKWQLLNVMVGLLKTDYTEQDLSYIKLGPKVWKLEDLVGLSTSRNGKKILIDIYILILYN